jgi:hypothetical protein
MKETGWHHDGVSNEKEKSKITSEHPFITNNCQESWKGKQQEYVSIENLCERPTLACFKSLNLYNQADSSALDLIVLTQHLLKDVLEWLPLDTNKVRLRLECCKLPFSCKDSNTAISRADLQVLPCEGELGTYFFVSLRGGQWQVLLKTKRIPSWEFEFLKVKPKKKKPGFPTTKYVRVWSHCSSLLKKNQPNRVINMLSITVLMADNDWLCARCQKLF